MEQQPLRVHPSAPRPAAPRPSPPSRTPPHPRSQPCFPESPPPCEFLELLLLAFREACQTVLSESVSQVGATSCRSRCACSATHRALVGFRSVAAELLSCRFGLTKEEPVMSPD